MGNFLLGLLLPMSLAGSGVYLLTLLAAPLFKRLRARQRRNVLLVTAALFVLPLPLLFSLAAGPLATYTDGTPTEDTVQTTDAPTATKEMTAGNFAVAETLRDTPATAPAYRAGGAVRAALEATPGEGGAAATGNTTGTPVPAALATFPFSPLQVLCFVYLLGAGISLAVWFLRYHRFSRRLHAVCTPLQTGPLAERYVVLCEQMGLRRRPALYECAWVSAPMLVGFFHARVVLPHTTAEAKHLEYALRHELTHYRQGDLFFKLFAMAVSILHWFNPLAHLLVRGVDDAVEACCDEAVAQSLAPQERYGYAGALLSFAGPAPILLPVSRFSTPARKLKQRLNDLVKPAKPSRLLRTAVTTGLALTLALCVLASCSFAVGITVNPESEGVSEDTQSALSSLPSAGDGSEEITPATGDTLAFYSPATPLVSDTEVIFENDMFFMRIPAGVAYHPDIESIALTCMDMAEQTTGLSYSPTGSAPASKITIEYNDFDHASTVQGYSGLVWPEWVFSMQGDITNCVGNPETGFQRCLNNMLGMLIVRNYSVDCWAYDIGLTSSSLFNLTRQFETGGIYNQLVAEYQAGGGTYLGTTLDAAAVEQCFRDPLDRTYDPNVLGTFFCLYLQDTYGYNYNMQLLATYAEKHGSNITANGWISFLKSDVSPTVFEDFAGWYQTHSDLAFL